MTDNVTELPRSWAKIARLDKREGRVRCIVSDRWFQFDQNVDVVGGRKVVCLDVMTLNSQEKPRKLSSLILDLAELKDMLISLDKQPVRES